MPLVDVRVYYLQMLAPPAGPPPEDRAGVAIVHARRPTLSFYRYLYDGVGRDYHWHSRGRLAADALSAVIQHQLNEMHVLNVEGTPAGFAELDFRQADDVELVQFGLLPEFIGLGLGRYFLHWTIDYVWRQRPRRFWLHTCTLDHPVALPNYLKAGFHVYREELIQREIGSVR